MFDSENEIHIKSPQEREAHFQQERGENSSTTDQRSFQIPWKGEQRYFQIFSVDHDSLLYNLNNTRTEDYQAEHIAKNNMDKNTFKQYDDIKAQNIQHQILKKYIDTTGDTNDSVIYKNLKNGIQTDPLVVTNDHRVISGNRRLCTMRILNKEAVDKQQKMPFDKIKIIILDRANETDIEKLEVELEEEDSFFIYADNYCEDNLEEFILAHLNRPKECLMTMMTFRTDDFESSGIVKVDDYGIVRNYYEKEKHSEGNLANGAVFIFSKEFISFLKAGDYKGEDFSKDILSRLINNIYTYETKDLFLDIGSVKNYLSVT